MPVGPPPATVRPSRSTARSYLHPSRPGCGGSTSIRTCICRPASKIKLTILDRTATVDVPVRSPPRSRSGRFGRRHALDGALGRRHPPSSGVLEAGSFLIIRGYDLAQSPAPGPPHQGLHPSHVLGRGPANRLRRPVWTRARSTPPARSRDHVPQVDQSDWSFPCVSWPTRSTSNVSVVDGALNFHAPTDASQAPSQGTYGSTVALQLIFARTSWSFGHE